MAELKVGEPAPDFSTTTDEGKAVNLSDFRGQRVILYFYPNDDTPGCTKQACSFRDSYAEIEQKNAIVLGVSPNDADSHAKFKSKYSLPFPLLMDEDHAIAEAYGVWGEKKNYGRTYMGIIRSHFVIDEEGKLTGLQYNVKPEASLPEAMTVLI